MLESSANISYFAYITLIEVSTIMQEYQAVLTIKLFPLYCPDSGMHVIPARIKICIWLTACTAALVAVLSPFSGDGNRIPTAPDDGSFRPGRYNVVILSVETERADHYGCYGYGRRTTPFADSVAGQGIVFDNFFATRSSTWPSLTSMLTSLYPVSSGVRHNGDLPSPGIPTLADYLKDNGYLTSAFISNFYDPGNSFDQRIRGHDNKIGRKAYVWLEQYSGEPFFMWMHFKAPHYPYTPPKDFDVFTDSGYDGVFDGSKMSLDSITLNSVEITDADLNNIISLYDGEVLLADKYISLMCRQIERLGLNNSTILVITSDHGEDLYQRNFYFYHSASIYDSTLHVPLIIRLPGSAFAGKRVKRIVENIDLAPTILELLGLPIPSGLHGESMVPIIMKDSGQDDSGFAIAERKYKTSNILTIRTDRWRYIYNPDNVHPRSITKEYKYRIDTEELYDIRKDPMEQNNVVKDHPDVAAGLREKLLANYPAEKNDQKTIRADKETMKRLKAMGYMGE